MFLSKINDMYIYPWVRIKKNQNQIDFCDLPVRFLFISVTQQLPTS